MPEKTPAIRRLPLVLRPDPRRVLIRPHMPAAELPSQPRTDTPRALKIMTRILAMTEDEIDRQWRETCTDFDNRHPELDQYCLRRFEDVSHLLPSDAVLSEPRKLVIGSYFSQEYALEAAALFNPSMVICPDQSGLADGALRFVLSLRAVGEGHISSIGFRCGTITPDFDIEIGEPARWVVEAARDIDSSFENAWFRGKCKELGIDCDFLESVFAHLPEHFSEAQLLKAVQTTCGSAPEPDCLTAGERLIMLARSNFAVHFSPAQRFSERVLFPVSPSQTNGIEDARFVRFVEDDGTITYYATYTAYDGRVIFPQLLETEDFLHFHFSTLIGEAVQNKGMALFPRRLGGRYAMLGRQDNENIRLMYSDDLYRWDTSEVVVRPTQPWEFVKMGNCGSPIELEAGWLVLTHGVGPMRKYSIGALLLDKNDPSRVIGRLAEPLIRPEATEQGGYVPNVVYTCGGLVHREHLVLPYATSDWFTSFTVVRVDDLLAAMH